MSKPMVRIYTDAENFIDREMNAAELKQYEIDITSDSARLAERKAATAAKAALLQRLGITAEEALLLLA
jgi:AmiR/NasT family two-component response regulator